MIRSRRPAPRPYTLTDFKTPKFVGIRAVGHNHADMVVVVVNLDPHHAQSGWVSLPVDRFDLDDARPYQMHDLLSGARYLWHGARNFVSLDPKLSPAHIFRLRRRVRTERDFDYFM